MDNLKSLRLSQKLTQQQLADAINVGRQAYAKWELGDREPDKAALLRMADYYDVTLDYLLGRSGARMTFTTYAAYEPVEKIRSGMEEALGRPISRRQAEALLDAFRSIADNC